MVRVESVESPSNCDSCGAHTYKDAVDQECATAVLADTTIGSLKTKVCASCCDLLAFQFRRWLMANSKSTMMAARPAIKIETQSEALAAASKTVVALRDSLRAIREALIGQPLAQAMVDKALAEEVK